MIFVFKSARTASLNKPKAGTAASYYVDSLVDTALPKALGWFRCKRCATAHCAERMNGFSPTRMCLRCCRSRALRVCI